MMAAFQDALLLAIEHGNLIELDSLSVESKTPLENFLGSPSSSMETTIAANDYQLFRKAVENGHTNVINRLLEYPSIYSWAEAQDQYQSIITPFIALKLAELQERKADFEAKNPKQTFNLTNSQEILLFFCIALSLIRLNNKQWQFAIAIILGLISVRQWIRTAINRNQINELSRLPASRPNRNAAYLLALSRQSQAMNSTEATPGEIAQDRESSMHALSSAEQKRLLAVQNHYALTMESQGTVKGVFASLQDELKRRYEANPAKIRTGDGRDLDLPLNWNDFQALGLSQDTKEVALKAYYQNKDHTAFRYLSKPNPWINQQSPYIQGDASQGFSSTFEYYQGLIAVLWLGASDKNTPGLNGMDANARMNHFVDELAHINRAHNWDRQDQAQEYDDLGPDNPSCYSGVTRRLYQSVIGHPLFEFLTKDNVNQRIDALMQDHFSKVINEGNRAALKQACDNYIINGKSDPILKTVNLSPEEQQAFIDNLAKEFPIDMEKINGQDSLFEKQIKSSFADKNIDAHILQHYTKVEHLLKSTPEEIIKTSFIKAKEYLRPCGEPGTLLSRELNELKRGTQSGNTDSWSGSSEKLAAILEAIVGLPEESRTETGLSTILADKSSPLFMALHPTSSQVTGDAGLLKNLDTNAACVVHRFKEACVLLRDQGQKTAEVLNQASNTVSSLPSK